MIYKSMKISLVLLALFASVSAFAQQPTSPEEQEKKLYDAIQEQVDRYAENLDLDDWQIFYVDSILTHNVMAIQEEFSSMQKAKVANPELYYDIQDKWNEETYNSLQKILDEEQWVKYLKQGAARDKKARDKRAAQKKK